MRAFQLFVIVCGILFLLTACTPTGGGDGDGESSASSVRSVSREGRVSSSSRSSSRSARSASSRSASASSVRSASSRSSKSSLRSSRSSARSSRSSVVSSSSSRSSRALFFSLPGSRSGNSSSASSSVVTFDLGTSSAPAAGAVKLHVEGSRNEARPGDQVSYVVTVRNVSTRTIDSVQIVFGFPVGQLTVLDTDGVARPGGVQWTATDLDPEEKVEFRMRAAIADPLPQGTVIRGTASALVNGVSEPQAFSTSLSIIHALPATGLGDGTGPLENTRRFLTPFRADGTFPAIPMIVWTVTIAMGIALGGRAARRFL
jgi:hypothetical protein